MYDHYRALKRQITLLKDNRSSSTNAPARQDVAALKTEKKMLHLMLSSYERGFETIHNRRVLSYPDIKPVASQYRRYKKIKRSISALLESKAESD